MLERLTLTNVINNLQNIPIFHIKTLQLGIIQIAISTMSLLLLLLLNQLPIININSNGNDGRLAQVSKAGNER
jgi:hypothetical protein